METQKGFDLNKYELVSSNLTPEQQSKQFTVRVEQQGADIPGHVSTREVFQNMLEAFTRALRVDPMRKADLKARMTKERDALYFADNGDGMTLDKMQEYLCAFGAGEGAGDGSNFNAGSRIGLLYRNPNGVEWTTWKEGLISQMEMSFNEIDGLYVFKKSPSHVEIDSLRPEFQAYISKHDSGTIVTLYGEGEISGDDTTEFVGSSSLLTDLSRRYWDLGGCGISVYDDKSAKDGKTRMVHGLSRALTELADGKPYELGQHTTSDGVVFNATIYQFSNNSSFSKQSWGENGGVLAAHNNELYPFFKTPSSGLSWCGISGKVAVGSIYVIIDVVRGAGPNNTRTSLLVESTRDILDLTEIGQVVGTNLPEEIIELMKNSVAKTSCDMDALWQQAVDSYLTPYSGDRSSESEKGGPGGAHGQKPGTGGSNGSSGTGRRPGVLKSPTGKPGGSGSRKPGHVFKPDVRFSDGSHTFSAPDTHIGERTGESFILNPEWSGLERLVDRWTAKRQTRFPNSTEEVLRAEVKSIAKEYLVFVMMFGITLNFAETSADNSVSPKVLAETFCSAALNAIAVSSNSWEKLAGQKHMDLSSLVR